MTPRRAASRMRRPPAPRPGCCGFRPGRPRPAGRGTAAQCRDGPSGCGPGGSRRRGVRGLRRPCCGRRRRAVPARPWVAGRGAGSGPRRRTGGGISTACVHTWTEGRPGSRLTRPTRRSACSPHRTPDARRNHDPQCLAPVPGEPADDVRELLDRVVAGDGAGRDGSHGGVAVAGLLWAALRPGRRRVVGDADPCSATCCWVGGPLRCSSQPTEASTMNWVGVRPSGRSRVSSSARQLSAACCSQSPGDSNGPDSAAWVTPGYRRVGRPHAPVPPKSCGGSSQPDRRRAASRKAPRRSSGGGVGSGRWCS